MKSSTPSVTYEADIDAFGGRVSLKQPSTACIAMSACGMPSLQFCNSSSAMGARCHSAVYNEPSWTEAS